MNMAQQFTLFHFCISLLTGGRLRGLHVLMHFLSYLLVLKVSYFINLLCYNLTDVLKIEVWDFSMKHVKFSECVSLGPILLTGIGSFEVLDPLSIGKLIIDKNTL